MRRIGGTMEGGFSVARLSVSTTADASPAAVCVKALSSDKCFQKGTWQRRRT